MKKIGLLWRKVQRPVSLAFVFLYLIAVWAVLFKGIKVFIR